MEKPPVGPKSGPSAPAKPAARPAKPEPESDTLIGADGSVAPVNEADAARQLEQTDVNTTAAYQDLSASEVDAAATASFEADDEAAQDARRAEPGPLDETTAPQPARPAAAAAKPSATAKPAAAGAQQGKVTTLGDFRLLKKLGQGGMGAVYKAHQVSLDREVAIKVLTKELAARPAFVQRFIREARVMAKLDHPNILRCFEVGEAHGYHYLAMEFVDGGSIDAWLKKHGKFSLGDALHIFLACARGLQHAHELKMVHRDVKPENVLLTKKGVVKVADLGLAKSQDDDLALTKTGTGAGTPIFMAPEQARDVKHVDGRSDIYSLGCMLYCFLTGEPPFKGTTLVELIEAKEKGKFTPVRRSNDEVPERLDLILDKMLARKPELRYQTCAEIIAEVEELGLHHDSLSFLQPEAAAAKGPASGKMPKPAAKPAAAAAPAAARPSAPSSKAAAPPARTEPEPDDDHFWVKLKAADGKILNKRLSIEQILGLIKNNACDADTPVSRTQQGGYRAMATYSQFEPALRAHMTKARADRKAEKFRSAYEKLEQEERSRQRWRWINNLVIKVGGGAKLIIWLAIVFAIMAALGIGIYFAVVYGMDYFAGHTGAK
jgi:serine/threonine-protein kinase